MKKLARRTKRDREMIRTERICKRLSDHLDAVPDRRTGLLPASQQMLPTQVKAAEILLDRRLPRLQRTQLRGDPDEPLAVEGSLNLSDEALAAIKKAFEEKF